MLAAGRLNSMKTRKMKLGVVAHNGGSNTQEAEAGLLAWGLVWDPVERGRTAHVPWNSWQGTVHSTLSCERPDLTRNLQQDGSPHQLPAVLASTTVTSELSRLPFRPPCPPDGRMQPYKFTNTRVAVSPVTGPLQAHHCRVFSKSFFSSGKTTNLCRNIWKYFSLLSQFLPIVTVNELAFEPYLWHMSEGCSQWYSKTTKCKFAYGKVYRF